MWLFTLEGFYSITAKAPAGPDEVCIRARVRKDLDNLRNKYLPTLGPTIAGTGTDYQYRAVAKRKDWAEALAKMGEDCNYSNFKGKIGMESHARSHEYMTVWSHLYDLEKKIAEGERREKLTAGEFFESAPYSGIWTEPDQKVLPFKRESSTPKKKSKTASKDDDDGVVQAGLSWCARNSFEISGMEDGYFVLDTAYEEVVFASPNIEEIKKFLNETDDEVVRDFFVSHTRFNVR